MSLNKIQQANTPVASPAVEKSRPGEPAEQAHTTIGGDVAEWSGAARPATRSGGDGKFTLGQATKFFAMGLAYPVLSLVEGFKQRPAQTALILGGGIAAFSALTWGLPVALAAVGAVAIAPFAVPVLLGSLAAFFGIRGGVNLVKGIMAARDHHAKGEVDLAEHDFERIGQGVFDIASAGFAGKQAFDAFRTAQATRAAAVLAAEAEAARVYAADMPARLADIEAKVGTLVKGQVMTPTGEAAMQQHLDWSLGKTKMIAEKQAIIGVLNKGGSFYEVNRDITQILGKGGPSWAQPDPNNTYYLTKHLIEIRARDLLSFEGSSAGFYPVRTGLHNAAKTDLARLAEIGPQNGIGHVVHDIKISDNFVQAVHEGNIEAAKRILTTARTGLAAAPKP